MSDYNSESFSDGSMPKVISTIIVVMITMIIVITVIIPFVSDTTHDEISNTDPSGVYMGYFEGSDSPSKTISVSLSDDKIIITGSYTKTVMAVDQIIVLANNMCLYVQDGVMYYYNGHTQSSVTTIDITYQNGKLNGHDVNWVYFPTQGGIYSSFTNIDYVISDKVGVKPGLTPTILSNWGTYEIDGKNVICNVKIRN